MRKSLVCLVVVCVIGLSALVGATRQQAPAPSPGAPASPAQIDEALKAMRADMQSSRADIMAKSLTLTADQAAKFWPVFNEFQKEQNVIMDAQLKGIQKYSESHETLDAAGALALVNALLERDAKMTALRVHWLAEFQKVVPGNIAARAIQIDRRLSNLAQIQISSQIPLVH